MPRPPSLAVSRAYLVWVLDFGFPAWAGLRCYSSTNASRSFHLGFLGDGTHPAWQEVRP